ncbi:MAG: PDZ domain-containing protein, partial [Candidatus Methylomirabilales bacterium]
EHDVLIFHAGGSRLGVRIEDIDEERARALKLPEERGVEVRSVVAGSPAETAGIQAEDVILEYQGERIESAAQLVRMVRETPAGRTVTLRVSRGGAERSFKVKVEAGRSPRGGRHLMRGHRIDIPPIEIPDIDVPLLPEFAGRPLTVRLGASVESLTDQLAGYFGVKDGEGVLVRSVKKGGPGDAAGLKAGDVIVRVDDATIADASDLRSALRDRSGKDASLTVVRDRREQKLQVRLPKAERRDEEYRLFRHGGSDDAEGTPPPGRQRRFERRLERLDEGESTAIEEAVDEALAELEAARAEIADLPDQAAIEAAIRGALEELHRVGEEFGPADEEGGGGIHEEPAIEETDIVIEEVRAPRARPRDGA